MNEGLMRNYKPLVHEILDDVWENFFSETIVLTPEIRSNPNVLFDKFEKAREILLKKYGKDTNDDQEVWRSSSKANLDDTFASDKKSGKKSFDKK